MRETYVRLLCPDCEKAWEESPQELPAAGDSFRCPDCRAEHRMAEFTRTDHDLETLKQLG